jgi:hypothetical protein
MRFLPAARLASMGQTLLQVRGLYQPRIGTRELSQRMGRFQHHLLRTLRLIEQGFTSR